jgi:ribosomal-protein-alanine N-acetyltransferase
LIETGRLGLRRLIPADLNALWALYQDPEITRYIPDAPRNFEETREELEWFVNGHPRFPELGLWATIERASGQFVGRCGLLPWTIDGQAEVEVAYTIARAHWGRGLATEAALAIRDYAFTHLNRARLVALIDPQNIASQRVAEKIGMRFERRVTEWEGQPDLFDIYSLERPGG